jgi:hypothetical protein
MKAAIKNAGILLILIFFILIFSPSISYSPPEYAEQTGFECKTCHRDGAGGNDNKQ